MSDMSVGSNVQVIPATKLNVKKHWTRNEVRNAGIATALVCSGAAAASMVLPKGKFGLMAVATASLLASLGLATNYFNMRKNNVDALKYTA